MSEAVDNIKRLVAGYEEVQRGLFALGIPKEANRWENVTVSKETLDAFLAENEENIRANKSGWYRDEDGEVHFTGEYDESVYSPSELQVWRPDDINGRWEISFELAVLFEGWGEASDLSPTGGYSGDGVTLWLNPAENLTLCRGQYILSGVGQQPGDAVDPEACYEPLVDHLEELVARGFLVPTDDPDIFETQNPGIEEKQAAALGAYMDADARDKAKGLTDWNDPESREASMVIYRAKIAAYKAAAATGVVQAGTAVSS